MITWNGFSLNNGGSTLIPKDTVSPTPIVTGSGFIFGAEHDVPNVLLFDPWYNAEKNYVGSYITGPDPLKPPRPIDNSYIVSISGGENDVYLSDEAWSATSANSAGPQFDFKRYILNHMNGVSMYRIFQFDFWHQFEFVQANQIIHSAAYLPDYSGSFKRGEALSKFNLNPMVYPEHPNWPVSTSYPDRLTRTWFNANDNIEPFITATKAGCPNVNGCGSLRYNYSPDYDHCCTAYPDWYN